MAPRTRIKKPDYWADAIAELSKTDKVMAKIIRSYEGETLQGKGDPFTTLARAIVGQQISVKAADSVWRKFEAGLKGKILPEIILQHEHDALRAHGLSRQKVLYLKDLSRYFTEESKTVTQWNKMDDDALIKSITSIHGIGRWTAEMFMIFHLMRPNVYPIADIGLQRAIERHYYKGKQQPLSVIRKQGEKWHPWRSVATWYLWRSLDPVPVEY